MKKYYLGTDNHFKYYIEELRYDEVFGWINFNIRKENCKQDADDFYLTKEEKFNFNSHSNDGFNLKKLILLENENLSREDRFSLVELGKSIEALIIVSEMCKWGCRDMIYMDALPEEQKILKDENYEKMTNEKILQLWDVSVKILERES